jgi:hypothetical protein
LGPDIPTEYRLEGLTFLRKAGWWAVLGSNQ